MRFRLARLLCILAFCAAGPLAAQTDSLIALWAEFAKDDPDLVERIQELSERPLNLNTADKDELLAVPLLSPIQADSILALRQRLGAFRSKRQIRSILGAEYYELTKAFFTIRSAPLKNGYFVHKNYFPVNVNRANVRGFEGSLFYDYNKFYYRFSERFFVGLVTQKDVGESSLLDYVSGYVHYKGNWFGAIAGSYKLEYGEGMVFSDPFGQQKSSLAVLPFGGGVNGARATLSSSENSNQFGLFGEVRGSSFLRWQVFYAGNLRDARLDAKGRIVIGLDYDGYHRTEREIDAAGRVNEQLLGSALTVNIGKQFTLGLLGSRIRYSPSLLYTPKSVGLNEWRRKLFAFSGEQISGYSAFYTWQWNRLWLSGEYALSDSKRPAYSQSVFLQADPVKIGVKFWHLDKNYQAPYARVFDDRSPFPRAAEGVYVGFQYKKKNWRFNFYRLLKKELWRSYFYPLPRQGREWLGQLDYRFKSAQIMLRYRHKQAEIFEHDALHRQLRRNENQDIYYLQARLHPTRTVQLTARWTHTAVYPFTEKGTALYQDVLWQIAHALQLNFRVTFYRSASYRSRLYEYESDLPGSFANYALYGAGHKWYVRIKWNALRFLNLWIKFRYAYLQDPMPATFKYVNADQRLDRSLRLEINIRF